ncbi:hypothetical protein HPP92_022904 [Vanilla planifolia]|uniref:Uncharacterized protein n=1 Tax=Vanilla planifolia TaxID=51239 RepID=A0A835UHN7_VANPL|nr:hypothetical protein HPP92_022904 [Vanilla planifolia]
MEPNDFSATDDIATTELYHATHCLSQPAAFTNGYDPVTEFLACDSLTHDQWIDSTFHELSSIYPVPSPRGTIEDEEESGIRLVHLLMSTARAVHRGEADHARSLIEGMRCLLTRVTTSFGIGKVAGYFVDALCSRLCSLQCDAPAAVALNTPDEAEILYHHFYEVCPYLKFAHFTANQSILDAFKGEDHVHVIDFNLMHGLQWPALIQALALRPGGPPVVRLTGIGPPSSDGRDNIREVGFRLAKFARSVNVPFVFRGVAASRLDDVRPWMLQISASEAVAVNSILQLHRLLADPNELGTSSIDSLLGWVAGLRPKIVTLVEQEADHNKPDFLDRFTKALFYYSTMFDSLEAGREYSCGAASVAELYLQREMCNVVCCEGTARVERHELLLRWRARMSSAGLKPVHLGSNAFKQASMLLTLFSGEGYCVDEVEGCVTLGWHGLPLISASAWQAGDEVPSPGSKNLPLFIPLDNNTVFNDNNNSQLY